MKSLTKKRRLVLKNKNCFYCGLKATTVDHVLARSQGGTNALSNLVPCCKSCNQAKGSKSVTEFLIEFYRLKQHHTKDLDINIFNLY